MPFQCQVLSFLLPISCWGSLFLISKHISPLLPWQDWDVVKRQEEACGRDEITKMIPRKLQEGSRADSTQRAPSVLTRSPVGGDAAGQRKEGESFCQHCGWSDARGHLGPWARLTSLAQVLVTVQSHLIVGRHAVHALLYMHLPQLLG